MVEKPYFVGAPILGGNPVSLYSARVFTACWLPFSAMGALDTEERQLLQAVLDRLAAQPSALRQTLADHQWSTISLMVDEFAYSSNLASGSPLTVSPQTGGLELITSIVAVVPAGATGLVQIGLQAIPVGAGPTILTPVQKLVSSTDVRSLTISGASGPATLWLTGQQMPTYGVMR